MDPRLQAGLELQLDKQAQQEHDSSLSGVLGQYFKKEAARKPGTGIGFPASKAKFKTMEAAPTGAEREAARKEFLHRNRKTLATTKEFPGAAFRSTNGMSAAAFKYLRGKFFRGSSRDELLRSGIPSSNIPKNHTKGMSFENKSILNTR